MLTRAQRMQAVPGLIEMVEDKKLDSETVKYGYARCAKLRIRRWETSRVYGGNGMPFTALR